MSTRREFIKKVALAAGAVSVPTSLLAETPRVVGTLTRVDDFNTEHSHYSLGFSISKQMLEDDHYGSLTKEIDAICETIKKQIDDELR